jgi:predicted P-loop ATPase
MMASRPQDMLSIEQIALALGGAKRLGSGGWSCRCPAHEDGHASLSLSEKDGKTLWRCHAGCDQTAVRDALVQRGLWHASEPGRAGTPHRPAQKPKPVAAKKAEPTQIGKIVATYDYVDVTGELLFQVVRFDPKTFRQRRPNGSGWEWGLGKVKPIPYRLPDIRDAHTVFVVEGERDVDNLKEKLGVCATSSPMGAGKWRMEFGEYLEGKHVVVLPDNDEPGRAHAEAVAASAAQYGARAIRIVNLPNLPEKGDVSDWLAAGGTLEDLRALVRETSLYGRPSPTGSGGDTAWRARLIQGDHGPLGNEANVAIALNHAPELVGRIRFDAFRTAVQMREMPWDARPEWRDWTDDDDVHLACWIQEAGINYPSHRLPGVVGAMAAKIQHHPVRDYLDGLKWDGERRLETWPFTYLGAAYDAGKDAALISAFGAKWMISAVARVFRPGCKADCALILEGVQGAGKSTSVRVLCGPDWYADQLSDIGNKDACQDLRGKWVIELAELKNVRGAEVEKVKGFMSRAVDHYRPSYARRTVDIPRQCVFIGSTNEDAYLHDTTGNRRFWPIKVGQIEIKALTRDRDQLWAEAVHRYREGDNWWLPRELEDKAEKAQADRLEYDTWAAFVEPWLSSKSEVTTRELIVECIGKEKKDITRSDETRAAYVLRSLGFRSTDTRHPIWGCRVYKRVDRLA